jgi:hypothetical protein
MLIGTANDNLKTIKLAKNNLTDKVACKLRDFISQVNGNILETIDMSDNNVGEVGGIAFAEIVKSDPSTLRVLDVSWNMFSKRPPIDNKQEEINFKKEILRFTQENYIEEEPEAKLGK